MVKVINKNTKIRKILRKGFIFDVAHHGANDPYNMLCTMQTCNTNYTWENNEDFRKIAEYR